MGKPGDKDDLASVKKIRWQELERKVGLDETRGGHWIHLRHRCLCLKSGTFECIIYVFWGMGRGWNRNSQNCIIVCHLFIRTDGYHGILKESGSWEKIFLLCRHSVCFVHQKPSYFLEELLGWLQCKIEVLECEMKAHEVSKWFYNFILTTFLLQLIFLNFDNVECFRLIGLIKKLININDFIMMLEGILTPVSK